jgi:hypothetical protein
VWGAKPNTEPHSNSDGDSHRDYYGNTDCYSNTYSIGNRDSYGFTYRNANRDGYSECDSDTYSHAGRVCFRTWLLEEPWAVAGKSIAPW